MAQTSRFIRPLIEFLFPTASPETFLLVHALIRKAAHFTEYFIFSLFALRAFAHVKAAFVSERRFILAVAAGLMLAVTDETLQFFSDQRTGSAIDVLIDLSGAAAAAVICRWYAGRRARVAETK